MTFPTPALALLPTDASTLAFLPNFGPFEMIVILVVALLIFGRRLPEVGRSLGRSLVEFKRGLAGIEQEVKDVTDEASKDLDSASMSSTDSTTDTSKSNS